MIHKIPTTQTILKGEVIKPGSIVILSGTYPIAPFCKDLVDVTITNEGPVFLQSGVKGDNCQNIRLVGNQRDEFKIIETKAGASAISFYNRSTDIEIAYLLISAPAPAFAGIMCKDDGAPRTSGFVMRNLHIHHNVIEFTGGEGIYIGQTKPEGHDLENVHVHHNILRKIGWDGMQFANVVWRLSVHDNEIYETGLNITRKEDEVQDNGIQLGERTTGEVFKNKVVDARGNAIICMGSDCDIYENDLFRAGESGIFSDSRPTTTGGNKFRKNVILIPKTFGIAMRDTHKKGFKNVNVNNTILNPGKQFYENGIETDKYEYNNYTELNLFLAEHIMKKS